MPISSVVYNMEKKLCFHTSLSSTPSLHSPHISALKKNYINNYDNFFSVILLIGKHKKA